MQQTRLQCFGDYNLFKLRDLGLSTAQHTILTFKEEQLTAAPLCEDGLAKSSVLCSLMISERVTGMGTSSTTTYNVVAGAA